MADFVRLDRCAFRRGSQLRVTCELPGVAGKLRGGFGAAVATPSGSTLTVQLPELRP